MNLEHPDFVFGELIDERAITPPFRPIQPMPEHET
jgi:hypothetical protein